MCCKKNPGLADTEARVMGMFVILQFSIIMFARFKLSGEFSTASGHVKPVLELIELLKTKLQSELICGAVKF